MLQLLLDNPSIYLDEIQQEVQEITGTIVHISTICRTIHRMGWTRQKLRHIAVQQSLEKRVEYITDISMFDPEMLIWLDETGSDCRSSIRSHGYSFRGLTPVCHQLVWGKRISAIGIMSMKGIEDIYIHEGAFFPIQSRFKPY